MCHIPLQVIVTCFKDNFPTSTPPLLRLLHLLRCSTDARWDCDGQNHSDPKSPPTAAGGGGRVGEVAHGRGSASFIPVPLLASNAARLREKSWRRKTKSPHQLLAPTRRFIRITNGHTDTNSVKTWRRIRGLLSQVKRRETELDMLSETKLRLIFLPRVAASGSLASAERVHVNVWVTRFYPQWKNGESCWNHIVGKEQQWPHLCGGAAPITGQTADRS